MTDITPENLVIFDEWNRLTKASNDANQRAMSIITKYGTNSVESREAQRESEKADFELSEFEKIHHDLISANRTR